MKQMEDPAYVLLRQIADVAGVGDGVPRDGGEVIGGVGVSKAPGGEGWLCERRAAKLADVKVAAFGLERSFLLLQANGRGVAEGLLDSAREAIARPTRRRSAPQRRRRGHLLAVMQHVCDGDNDVERWP
jgi:hypothetical protein